MLRKIVRSLMKKPGFGIRGIERKTAENTENFTIAIG